MAPATVNERLISLSLGQNGSLGYRYLSGQAAMQRVWSQPTHSDSRLKYTKLATAAHLS